ncbi:MAG TPA: septum formation initiator family protein [Kribbellaceae bacterium]
MPSRRDPARPGARPGPTRPTPGRGRGGTPKRRTTSAAPAPASGTTPAARPARNLTGRAAVVLLVLGALVVSYAQSLRFWFDQHQQITALQKEIDDRQRRVGELQEEVARWDDKAYVRAQARQRLGWVMPGEVGYRVIGADGKPLGTTTAPSGTTGTEHPDAPTWYTKLWGSVRIAGTTTPAPVPTTTPGTPPHPVITPTNGQR